MPNEEEQIETTEQEVNQAIEEAKKAAELASTNIKRFLDLQARREAALIMKAHEQQAVESAKAAEAAANLAAINIRRFIDLQRSREGSLIMRAHQERGAAQKRKG